MTPWKQLTGAATMLCAVFMAACTPAATSPSPIAIARAEEAPPEASAVRLSFIVNFRSSHALGRAQALQGAGRFDEASELVAATMGEDTALRGLCFERFTLGGAEIVLSVCAPSSLEEAFRTQRRWLELLGATPGVAYVERNLVARHEDGGGP